MSNPKEKAKELYWKYYQNISDTSFPEETAKQCALIAVEEIIKNEYDEENEPYEMNNIKHWQEVKQEIKNL